MVKAGMLHYYICITHFCISLFLPNQIDFILTKSSHLYLQLSSLYTILFHFGFSSIFRLLGISGGSHIELPSAFSLYFPEEAF